MVTKEQIESLVLEKIQGTGIFLVDVNIHSGNSIIVLIDKAEGINIEACVEVTRHINSNFDREKEDYGLEVSSPGLGSTFKVKEQYLKNIGRNIEVVKNDGVTLKGKLLSYSEKGIQLEMLVRDKTNKKNKNLIIEIVNIESNDIKSSKSLISFK